MIVNPFEPTRAEATMQDNDPSLRPSETPSPDATRGRPPARQAFRRPRFAPFATTLVAATLFAQTTTGQDQAPAASATRTSTQLFDDCRAQEKIGDACSCWQLFGKKYPKASPGETAIVEAKLATCSTAAKPAAGDKSGKPVQVVFPKRTVEDDKCYLGHKKDGAPSAILADLVQRCGAPAGMIKMTSVLQGVQRDQDNQEKYQVHLDADECYRFFVVGDSGIQSLQVGIYDPAGQLVAKETDADRIKILPPTNGFCPKTSAVHKIVISVAGGAGRYAMQGFRRLASAPAPIAGSGRQQALLDLSPDSQPLTLLP